MKYSLRFTFSLALISMNLFSAMMAYSQTATPPSGSGTSGDPYLIATLDNLYWLSQSDTVWDDNAYFQQTADIDASSTSTWDAGAGFTPIGNLTTDFTGTYDGGGHTISNLFINRSLETNVGLFGVIDNATITNISLVQVNITGNSRTGSLIGFANSGSIVKNSYATGLVSANSRVGGLIGVSSADSVLRVYSSVEVTSIGAYVGGLIAEIQSGILKDSYATGSVTGFNRVGGLVGANLSLGIIENSYSTALVSTTGGTLLGGLAGNNSGGTITNSYWDTETSGESDAFGIDTNGQSATGLTTAQMRQQANFSGFDFTNTWTMWEDFSEPYLQAVSPDSVGDFPFSFYPTGSGTSGDPYLIATLDNLFILSQVESIWDINAYFQQTADIDASATSGWNSGEGFSPIGNATTPFKGTYNGGGYTISNLFIDTFSESNIGLFGWMDSTMVRELGLVQAKINGYGNNTGALAGYAGTESIIKKIYVTGSVSASINGGGLIGTSFADSVLQVYSSARVNSETRTGGLIGDIGDGIIEESYVNGAVSGSSAEGGIAGRNSGTLINTYWDTQKSGTSTGIVIDNNGQNPIGLTTAEMRQDSSFTGFDFGTTWAMFNGFYEPYLQGLVPDSINGFAIGSYPSGSGTSADPFLISSLESLEILSETSTIWNSGAHFLQTTDIDASATSGWNSGAGFSPIGDDANRFIGSYNGGGYSISNLFINRDTQTHIGLFGAADSAGFYNLTLEAVDITGLQYTGGLLGLGSQLDTLSNISVSGSIDAAITDDDAFAGGVGGRVVFRGDSSYVLTSSATVTAVGDYAGGLFGEFDGNLTDSHASGDVSGDRSPGGLIGLYEPENASVYSLKRVSASGNVLATDRIAGGLIGEFYDASLSDSYATGSVTNIGSQTGGLIGTAAFATITNSYARGNINGVNRTGGFIGQAIDTPISNSYSSGTVNGTSEIGGFVGRNRDAIITNSYSTGSVSGTSNVGGFAGENRDATITNSYSSGSVSGTSNLGGFVGENDNGIITNGYWNMQTSGQDSTFGIDNNGQTATGLSSREMAQQSSFPTFDFTNTWGIIPAFSEPYLQFNAPDSVNGFAISDLPSGSGTAGDPFRISTLNQLNILSQFPSSWGSAFLQTADIDASETSGWNSGLGFSPIGSDADRFNGSYDGDGHTISNLFINRDTQSYIGLFGAADSASFSNLTLEAVDITGSEWIGGLLGFGSHIDTLANISVSGNIMATDYLAGGIGGEVIFRGDSSYALTSSATISATIDDAGGLFGAFDGNLTDSHASGDVSGRRRVGGVIGSYNPENESTYFLNRVSASGDIHAAGRSAGGLIGEFYGASISNSFATGSVTSADNRAGGLLGYSDFSTIINSYASGSVNGSSEVGGFVGFENDATITNSYSTGSVSGSDQVGGFIGWNRDATITNSYSTGSVSGTSSVGGFVGENDNGTITDGYWNTIKSGQSNGFGTGSGDATGLTTVQMIDSTNFPGLDFSTSGAWNIDDGFSFPFLRELEEHRMIVATIDSGEGWRMIGNPGDVTYSELLDPVFTQGYEGSDGGTGFAPNVYFYEESTQTWTAPSKASDYFGKADSNSVNTALNGILLYVYGDDDGDGNEDSWPKYLLSESTTLNDTLDVSLSYTDNVSADSAGWNLVSNPYPVSLDWTEVVTNGDITNTFPVAYIWDDSLNAGAGAYRINYGYPLPPGLPQDLVFDGPIPAMQAFWVKATSTGASLSFKPDYQGASQVLYKQQPDHDQQPPVVPWISLSINNGHFSDQAVLFNSDVYKAPKLSTIASRYTEISIADDEQLWAATSLDSLEHGKQVTFPIHLSTTETGTFTFKWNGLETFGSSLNFELRDHLTGETISLAEANEFSFELATPEKKSPLERGFRGVSTFELTSAKELKVEGVPSRFDLRVTAGTLVSDEPEQDLPATYALAQNYPNPFNPSTNIQFELPESGNVELLVFDILGRQVATLIDDRMEAGYHQIRFDARNLASGVYLYQLRAGNTVLTKKLTLIK